MEYKLVYQAQGNLDGEMIKNFLESFNIPVLSSQESAGKTYGLTIGSLGLVDILVPADRVDEAMTLLEKMEDGLLEDNSITSDDQTTEPDDDLHGV